MMSPTRENEHSSPAVRDAPKEAHFFPSPSRVLRLPAQLWGREKVGMQQPGLRAYQKDMDPTNYGAGELWCFRLGGAGLTSPEPSSAGPGPGGSSPRSWKKACLRSSLSVSTCKLHAGLSWKRYI